jgi:PAS domain S-box-containing protein
MMPLNQTAHKREGHKHLLQFYQADERALATNVGRYLHDGLKNGDGLLVIAGAEHRLAFLRRLEELGADSAEAVRDGQLVLWDAEQTLARFMIDKQPDWARFESTIQTAIREIRPRRQGASLRAYGEMVGILWTAGEFEAAIRLEGFWNRLLESAGFTLFCAYPIDVFAKNFHGAGVDPILCSHTHLVPTGENGDLEVALNRALEDVLGTAMRLTARATDQRSSSSAVIPRAESLILSLRNDLPEQAEEVLSRARQHYESEKRFRALIENSSDAIALLDSQGRVLYASASTTRVLGHVPHELLGRDSLELIHPDDRKLASAALQKALAAPLNPAQVEARFRRGDGRSCWIEITFSNLLDDPNVRAVVSNCRDISERKTAEEKQRRQSEELERSNSELQAFAYAATHDLREPLRTVSAFTQLLVQNARNDDKNKQCAELIVAGVNRMSTLLDDLLTFASLSSPERQDRVELRQCAEQALKNLDQAVQESGAAVTLGPLPAALGSESHLVELFQNLFSNAIKYRSTAPVDIHVTAEKLDREWVVKVKDNGLGIDPEYHDQIFGLFKRLHSQSIPGTGIGLAICKKIVEEMGGKIWVESELGKGCVFCFTVPDADHSLTVAVL